jgi:protein phosphatase
MDYALSCIIGKRENQEDYGVIQSFGSSLGVLGVLAVIADGMGGQVAGEVASSSAVNGFVESFTSNKSKNLPLKLSVALDKANRSLAKSIAKNPRLHGMGATLIAAHIEPGGINWVSVGDSILYLYRDKKLRRLNADHSMMPVLQESVRLGKITQEEARVHPHRNALRSALTGEEISIVDLREEPLRLKKGDLIVLATDGILTLSEPEIGSILARSKAQPANVIADHLLEAVTQINKPRQDNTLVEVIKISGGIRTGFKWTDGVTAIFIIVIAAVLTSFAWDKKETILHSFGITSEQESTAPNDEAPKVVPLPVDPTVTVERKEVNPADQTQSAPLAESLMPSKLTKPSPDRRLPATNKVGKTAEPKATPKVDASAKRMISDVKPPTSESGSHPAMPAAKTDSVPKSDEERPKQVMEADNTPKGKAEADRKE